MLPQEKRRTFASSLLLILAVFSVFGIPLFPLALHRTLFMYSLSAIFWAALLSCERHRRPLFLFALVAMVLEVLTSWVQNRHLHSITRLIIFVFFFVVIYQLLSQIVRQHRVTPRVILEAISGYLLLGLCCSLLVVLLTKLNDQAYSFTVTEDASLNFHCVYFGFVTLSTLGYGDFLPLSPAAQSLAILTSVVGQLYLTIVIALLVGKYIGHLSAREMQGHPTDGEEGRPEAR